MMRYCRGTQPNTQDERMFPGLPQASDRNLLVTPGYLRCNVQMSAWNLHVRYWLRVIVPLAFVYFLVGTFGHGIASGKENFRIVSFSSGFALAAICLGGTRVWPAVFIGAVALGLRKFHEDGLSLSLSLSAAIVIAVGSTLQAIIGTKLLEHFGVTKRLSTLRSILVLIIFSAALASTIKAAITMAFFSIANIETAMPVLETGLSQWLGSVMGVLVLTPVLLTADLRVLRLLKPHNFFEISAVLIGLVALCRLLFASQLPLPFTDYPISFAIFPFVIWASLRYGRWMAAMTMMIIAIFASWGTAHNLGLFARGQPDISLLILQSYLAVLSVIGMIISTTIYERNQNEMRLQEANTTLKKKTEELAHSNKELEQFAFVASHDLQEPLRKVIAFGNLLYQEYTATLPEEAQGYISRMKSACERMQNLIDDILKYSRITTKAKPFESFDLDDVIQEVIADLEITIKEKNASIITSPLPNVFADRIQMRQLFQNLIGNALKYAKEQQQPKIVISSVQTDSQEFQIVVEDQGIGFDQKFVDKIFQPFQRLHKRSDYQGTGIGLAICQKIAQRHGGSIQAQSELGKGSKFFVVLPLGQ
jgi:signal transduction histidine kinase